MLNKTFSKLLLVALMLVLLCGISSINAAEGNQTMVSSDAGTVGDIQVSNDNQEQISTVTKKTFDKEKTVSKTKKDNKSLKTSKMDVSGYDDLYNQITTTTDSELEVSLGSGDYNITRPISVPSNVSSLTINGNGVTVDGNNNFTFLSLSSGKVTVNNLTIKNTVSSQLSTGAITVSGGELSVANTTFINNTGLVGSVYVGVSASCVMDNAKFINNNFDMSGCVWVDVMGKATLTNSLFENNYASEGQVGYVNFWSELSITDCTFVMAENCSADFIMDYGGTITTSDNTYIVNANGFRSLSNNIALYGQETNPKLVINLRDGDYNITRPLSVSEGISSLVINGNNHVIDGQNTTYFLSSSSNVSINNLSIINCTNDEFGGAIYNAGVLDLVNVVIENSSSKQNGGAIVNAQKLTMINTTLINNTADLGGAIYNNFGSVLIINNSFFKDNTANSTDVIYNYQGELILENSTIASNKPSKDLISGNIEDGSMLLNNNTYILSVDNFNSLNNNVTYFTTNWTNNTLIFNLDSDISYTDEVVVVGNINLLAINGNQHEINGINTDERFLNISPNKMAKLNNLTITNTKTPLLISSNGTLIVNNSIFTNNNGVNGGAISNNGTLIVENSKFTNNTATLGGAIFNNNKTILNNNIFTDNTAGNGAVIYTASNNQTIINNNTFASNKALTNGYIITNTNDGILTITNNQFTNNTNDNNEDVLFYQVNGLNDNIKSSNNTYIQNNLVTTINPNDQVKLYNGIRFNVTITPYNVYNNTINEGNLIVEINSNKYSNVSIVNSQTTITIPYTDLPNQENEIKLTYQTDSSNYQDSISLVTIEKLNSNIEIEYNKKIETSQTTLNITLTDTAGNSIQAGTITATDSNGKVISTGRTDANGRTQLELNNLTAGDNVLLVAYNGTGEYLSSNNTITITVKGYEATIIVNPVTDSKINNTIINGTLIDTNTKESISNAIVQIIIDNNEYTSLTGNNGEFSFNLNYPQTSGQYQINVTYEGNDYYEQTSTLVSVTTDKINTVTTINRIEGIINDNIKLQAYVTDMNGNNVTTGYVTFNINDTPLVDSYGNIIQANVTNGVATTTIKLLKNYNQTTLVANYHGDNIFNDSQASTTITLSPRTATVELIPNNYTGKIGDKITFIAKISENATLINQGYVSFKLNGITLIDSTTGLRNHIKVKDGIAIFEYTIPKNYSGKNYNITVVYGGADYSRAEADGVLTVVKTNTHMEGNIINISPNGTAVLNVKVYDDANNLLDRNVKVSIKINGITMLKEVTVVNGSTNFDLTLLPSSKTYNITIITGENSNYLASNTTVTCQNTMEKINTTINTTATVNNDKTTVSVNVKDVYGRALTNNPKVSIKVDGKTVINSQSTLNGVYTGIIDTPITSGTHKLEVVSGETNSYASTRQEITFNV